MNLLRTTALAAASLLAASLLAPAPAQAVEPDWRQTITGADGAPTRVVAVASAPAGLTYVLSDDLRSEQARLTGLETSTGAVRWTIAEGLGFAGSGSSGLVVDERTGAAVLSTSSSGPSQVRSVAADGTVQWTARAARRVLHHELTIDDATGTVCATGAAGEVSRGTVECWSRTGRALLSERIGSRGLTGSAEAIGVDGDRRRVYVAADLRVRGAALRPALIAYSFGGRVLWRRVVSTERRAGALDLAVDTRRGRVHLLSRDARRARLTGFTSAGRRTSTAVLAPISGVRPRPFAVDVLRRSGRVAVTAQRPANGVTSVRVSTSGGRLVATRTLDLCCEPATPVVDEGRDRLVLVTGARASASRDEGASVTVVDARADVVLDESFLPAGTRPRVVAPTYDPVTSILVTGLRAPTGDDADPGTVLGLRLP